jgi:hypothetical protein
LTSFSYKNCTVSDDAEQARVEVAKAVAKAVEVTRPALTAAGEP